MLRQVTREILPNSAVPVTQEKDAATAASLVLKTASTDQTSERSSYVEVSDTSDDISSGPGLQTTFAEIAASLDKDAFSLVKGRRPTRKQESSRTEQSTSNNPRYSFRVVTITLAA